MKFFKRKRRSPAELREDAERGFSGRETDEDEKEDKAMEDEEKIVTAEDIESAEDDKPEENEPDFDSMSSEDFADYIERMREEEGLPPAFPEEKERDEDKPEAEEPVPPETEPEPAPEAEEKEPEKKPEPWRTYATEAEYKADVDKAISEALKQRDLDTEAQRARYERMERISRGFYPDDEAGFDKVADELEEQLAKSRDMTVDDYRSEQDMRAKAAKWDEQEKQRTSGESEKELLIKKWIADAGNLMRLYPDFSLEDALKDPVFAEELKTGGDMFSAYSKVYLGGPGDGDKEPAPDTETPADTSKREPIPQNASSKRRGTGTSSEDYAHMSSQKFKEAIRRMREA
ncbi:MAG: hypothetical protein IJH37_05045 [Clostridia bacterium]|nr:hypothetical protein [Clostridia bacterium]